MHADFWDGHQIRCVRNGWPSAPNGVIECTYNGCEFYWHKTGVPLWKCTRCEEHAHAKTIRAV